MKIFTTLTAALILTLSVSAQTIDKSPIYEGYQRLTVEASRGGISWFYQNPDYTTIIDIVSFRTSKEEAIALMDECVRLLAMERTGKKNHIRHEYAGVKMTRYGFAQKTIYLDEGLQISKKTAEKIKDALINYDY